MSRGESAAAARVARWRHDAEWNNVVGVCLKCPRGELRVLSSVILMAYPDYGGGAAYGDAYEQGAGFYAAGAENESPNKGGKGSKSGQPVLPVTICQINVLMRETGGEGSFTLDVNQTLICSRVSVEF